MLESLTYMAAAADPVEFWIAVCVAAGIAALALYRALRAFSGLRLIADTPTARIRAPGDRRLPFIIAADDERSLQRRLGLEALGFILLSLALSLGLILALIARLEPG